VGAAIAVGTMLARPPAAAVPIVVGGSSYWYYDNAYYTRVMSGGRVVYQVVGPPPGAGHQDPSGRLQGGTRRRRRLSAVWRRLLPARGRRLPGRGGEVTAWRVWVPALALAIVAAAQVTLTQTAALSPWKGGGFGMFETTDGMGFRFVRIFVDAPARSEEIALAPSLEDAASRAVLFPSDALLTGLAEAVVAREDRYRRPVAAVRLEVWGMEFDGEPLTATEHRLRSFRYVAGSHGS
jgi:hypothetical protein